MDYFDKQMYKIIKANSQKKKIHILLTVKSSNKFLYASNEWVDLFKCIVLIISSNVVETAPTLAINIIKWILNGEYNILPVSVLASSFRQFYVKHIFKSIKYKKNILTVYNEVEKSWLAKLIAWKFEVSAISSRTLNKTKKKLIENYNYLVYFLDEPNIIGCYNFVVKRSCGVYLGWK